MIGIGSKNQKVNGSLCFFKCNNDFKKKSFILMKILIQGWCRLSEYLAGSITNG